MSTTSISATLAQTDRDAVLQAIRTINLEEMRKDVQLFEALYPVLLSLSQLQELVDDTSLAVGSEAYAAALQVYNYAKASGRGTGLDAVVVEMRKRFARKGVKVESKEPML